MCNKCNEEKVGCDRCKTKYLPGDMFYMDCGDLICEYCYDSAREDGESSDYDY